MKESSSICPTCHSPIPADAPGGLCPACALEGAASVATTSTVVTRTPPPSIEEIAPHFPDLEILELLGAGGMGVVYKARQPQLDRTVALKILSRELTQEPAFVERFNREARVLARLSHPNIVGVFDFGTAGPYCYLLMEYVDGVNLRQAMRTGGFKPAEALALVQELCAALQCAHEEGILHRDIKPENILIDSKGRVKIADFGIAKLVGAGAASDVTLTLQGSILGSPHYMAPEQIETPGDVDQRADIYSLGVVLYEMLTGELPIGRFALPSEKAAMDARIDEIVMRTLEKERERRYQTVNELKTGFEGIGDPPPPSQAAFINEQLLAGAKYTFWIAMILLAMMFFDLVPAFSGDTDDLLDATHHFPYLSGGAILLASISAILRGIHTIRTLDTQPDRSGVQREHAPIPIRRNLGITHLGATAAILTGVSLLFAGVTVYLANIRNDADVRMIIIAIGVIVDGPIAIIGFILGAKALAEIRQSGGTKEGLGTSVFAVVLWPVLLLGAFGSFFFSDSMPSRSGGAHVSHMILSLMLIGAMLLALLVLVRGLRRWACGVADKNGEKRHPGLVVPVLSAIGVMVIGVVTIETIGRISHGSPEDDPYAGRVPEPSSEIPRAVEISRSNPTSDGRMREWRLREPEIRVPFSVPAGERVTIRLVLQDDRNAPETILEERITGPTKMPALLEVGTQLRFLSGPPGAIQELVVEWTAPNGRSLHSNRDLRGWVFDDDLASKIDTTAFGHQESVIASLDEDGTPPRSGTLTLVVIRDSADDE